MIKILFSVNLGMQNIGKNFGLFTNKNINLNPFEKSKEYKFWDFTWIEIILPRFYKNIDKETIFINLGLFKKIIKI